MSFSALLINRSTFFGFTLFFFVGIVCGLVFLISIGLSTVMSALLISVIVIPFVAIITGSPEKVLLGLLILCIPFNVDKSFFLHPEHTGGAVGLSISIWEISLFFLFLIWISEVLLKKDQEIHFLAKWSIPIFCLIGFSILSTINSSNITLSIFEIIQLIKVYLLFFFVANYIKTEKDLRYVVCILFLTFFLECTLGIVQYISGRSFDLAILGGGGEKFARTFGGAAFRVSGTFGTSNAFGSYIIMLLPLILSLLFFTIKRTHRMIYGSLLIMGVISLILTLSRGAWVGFIISVTVLLLLLHSKSINKPKAFLMGSIFLLTITIIVFTLRETIVLRLYSDDHGSALSRIPMMRIAFEMIKQNPVFGIGINNYIEVMANYDPTGLAYCYFHPVHNVYLQIAAEIGVFGLCIFLWFLFVLYREALQNFKKSLDFASNIRIGLIGGITALLVHSMVNNGSVGDGIFILFWLFTGLLVATIRMSPKRDKGNAL
ncbi:MAG: O-antigen ligase family protein [Candidatus Hodarchaeota archaeon]